MNIENDQHVVLSEQNSEPAAPAVKPRRRRTERNQHLYAEVSGAGGVAAAAAGLLTQSPDAGTPGSEPVPSIQKPAQQSVQQPLQQPVRKPVQQPIQQPIQQSIQQPVQQQVQQPLQQPVQQSVQQPLQQPIRQPVQQPVQQSVKPAQSAKTTQSVKPAQPAKATQSVNPVQSAKTTQSVKPAQPAKSTQPVNPVQSAKTTQSVKPAQPAKSTQPVKPAQSAAQTQSVNPAQTTNPPQAIEQPARQGISNPLTDQKTQPVQPQSGKPPVQGQITQPVKPKVPEFKPIQGARQPLQPNMPAKNGVPQFNRMPDVRQSYVQQPGQSAPLQAPPSQPVQNPGIPQFSQIQSPPFPSAGQQAMQTVSHAAHTAGQAGSAAWQAAKAAGATARTTGSVFSGMGKLFTALSQIKHIWVILTAMVVAAAGIVVATNTTGNNQSIPKSDQDQVYELVDRYVNAVKNLDVTGMVKCAEPAYQQALISQISLSDLSGDYSDFYNKWEEVKHSFNVTPYQFDQDGDYGTVYVRISAAYEGKKAEWETNAKVIKSEGKWYFRVLQNQEFGLQLN